MEDRRLGRQEERGTSKGRQEEGRRRGEQKKQARRIGEARRRGTGGEGLGVRWNGRPGREGGRRGVVACELSCFHFSLLFVTSA